MSTTTFSPTAANNSGLLTHAWTPLGRRIPFWFDESIVDLMAGAGGIISSAEDMVRWLSALLNEGQDPTTNKTVIPKSVFDAVTTAQIIVGGKLIPASSIVGYGMGWMRTNVGTADVSRLVPVPVIWLLTRCDVDASSSWRLPWFLGTGRIFTEQQSGRRHPEQCGQQGRMELPDSGAYSVRHSWCAAGDHE